MVQMTGYADMHMHTNLSDGASSVQELLDYVCRQTNLAVIAITDHDRLDASLWAYENRHRYPFDIVPGVEVTSREGHVLAWWVTERIPAGLSLEETVQAIHETGGVAVLAHPFQVQICETRKGAKRYFNDIRLIERAGFDAVEVVNAAAFPPGSNALTKVICGRLQTACVANSDAHTLNGIGSGHTLFPGCTADDLRHAIESRQTQPVGGMWSPMAYGEYFKSLMNGTISYDGVKDYHPSRGLNRW
ncbi:MAG: PHP-associated domain-containing protein [Chloroflexota bacterium]